MTQSQADEARRLLAAGFTRVRIAELLGVSQSTVIGFFRRGGTYSNEPRRTPKPRRKPKL
jgi:predicted transcriptional regulator